MTKEFSVNRLDIKAFAQHEAALDGEQPMGQFPRLMAEDLRGEAAAGEPVHWSLDGEWREATGGPGHAWLHLQADTAVQLQCQRCLRPVDIAVQTERSFRFVKDEATAAALDDESEEDVLVMEPNFNAHELIEDDLLMALPMGPMHDECPVELKLESATQGFEEANTEKANPFAALASLRLDKTKP